MGGVKQDLGKRSSSEREVALELLGKVMRHGVYSGSGCPKCDVRAPQSQSVKFCPGRDDRIKDPTACPIEGQHLHGICNSCGFYWLEQTADADALGDEASPIEGGFKLVGGRDDD